MALFFDAAPGDVIRIGETYITIGQKTGRKAQLRIDTKLDVKFDKATPSSLASPPATAGGTKNPFPRPR